MKATAAPKAIFITLIYITLILASIKTYAQTPLNAPIPSGEVKGIVQDSAYNFVLNGATVAVYEASDSGLLQFTIPNTFGEFSIRSLPVDTLLRLIITHVGYKAFLHQFIIPKSKMIYDFGKINMDRKSGDDIETMDEVVVEFIPPMQMNGDTLEFNADAFKMDSNATAEDLMRRLPGFTFWGDGAITFNGKEISSILVNGKPFFNNDFAVITQNLPKNSIDKVQVYQQKNENNPLDSTMNANIKLKEEINTAYFGKISAGAGTDKRFAADGTLGYFNDKMQVSVVAATNNINKVANSVNTLMRNSTFKGVGANIDYQPNFSMQGLNKPFAAGATFQYDFLPDVNYFNAHRLKADYFLSHNNTQLSRNTLTINVLGIDSVLKQKNRSGNSNIYTRQNMNAEYVKNSRQFRLRLNSHLAYNDSKFYNESTSEQERTGVGVVSNNSSTNESNNINRTYNFEINYSKLDPDYYKEDKRFINSYNISYNLNVLDNDGSSKRSTNFNSLIDPSANKEYSRFYAQDDALSINNHIHVEYEHLKRLVFGKAHLAGINLRIASVLYLNNNEYTDKVLDWDEGTQKYRSNSYLTNTRNLDIVNILPYLKISKSFSKQLSNRYSKNVTLSATARSQHYSFHHTATQRFQNIDFHYNKFVPHADFIYSNNQFGAFNATLSLSYYTNVEYPEVDQLAPLIDSSNVLYLPMGNLNLMPERSHTLSLTYYYWSRKKNPLIWNMNVKLGKTNSFITDSTLYDELGRRIVYYTNLDGRRFLSIRGSIKKSFQQGENSNWQVSVRSHFNFNKNPNYLNSIYNISKVISSRSTGNINYTYKDIFALKFEQGLSLYSSVQEGFNKQKLKSRNLSTMMSGSVQLPKNLNWSSNITFNRARSNNTDAVNFAIWNASVTYRFLKGKRGEVKFSALDLLRENKSIVNYVRGNAQSFGYVNVLQQYFMLTFSFYPRKFGK